MRLGPVRQRCDKGAEESQSNSNDTGWKTHFWLSNSMVAFCRPGGDAVGQWTAEVGADERTDKWGEENETLIARVKVVWSDEWRQCLLSMRVAGGRTYGGAKS
jgi:hypothetical protein